jgi:hypothetical protein
MIMSLTTWITHKLHYITLTFPRGCESVSICVSVCVCVCVYFRGKRMGEREKELNFAHRRKTK